MAIVWLAISFNCYLILFLVNKFEQVYTTAFLSSLSEMVGNIAGATTYERIRAKGSLSISFMVTIFGSGLLLVYGL